MKPAPAGPSHRARAFVAIGSHAVVDFFSFIIVPLMSVLEGRVHMTPGQGAIILAAGSIASGLVQPLVAWLSDRFDTRWLGTLAFLIAVVAVGCVGFVHTFEALLLLQVIACAGNGAYHPVAAAAVGHLCDGGPDGPRRRAAGLARFYAAGMIGGVVGNLAAPAWTRSFGGGESAAGLWSIAWFIPPGLLAVAVLALAIHSVPHRHDGAHARHAALTRAQRIERWRSVWLLYFGNVLRFLTDMCLIQLIIRWTEERAARSAGLLIEGLSVQAALTPQIRTEAAELNGILQAARQVGIGVGGLVLLRVLRGRSERAVLIVIPLLGAFVVAATPMADAGGWLAIALCALAGVGYGGVIPTTLSLAQRLLPHRTSLASGLMLGGAWAIASAGPPLVQWLYTRWGLGGAFLVTSILLAASGVVAMFLRGQHDPAVRSDPVA